MDRCGPSCSRVSAACWRCRPKRAQRETRSHHRRLRRHSQAKARLAPQPPRLSSWRACTSSSWRRWRTSPDSSLQVRAALPVHAHLQGTHRRTDHVRPSPPNRAGKKETEEMAHKTRAQEAAVKVRGAAQQRAGDPRPPRLGSKHCAPLACLPSRSSPAGTSAWRRSGRRCSSNSAWVSSAATRRADPQHPPEDQR